jgi:GntR family transcriptional regulator/MocR family aminotransferase
MDTEGEAPLYLQLYDYIKAEIQSGRIVCSTKLPSKRKLSSHLGISQNTIQAAYDQLIEEGYVMPVERKGFYVCKLDNIVRLESAGATGTRESRKSLKAADHDFSYHGVDMPNFPFTTWRRITKDVINEYDGELLRSGDIQGNASLRRSIADYLRQSRGVKCSADQIVVSAGTEYLFQILIQLLGKDSVYGIENPGYEKLNLLFNSSRARFKAINIDSDGMVPEEIRKSGADVICITPAHQFPSGVIMPINRRIQILNWANEIAGRYIIEDDYDSEFKYSGKPIPALQGLDSGGKVIYMGAFSKSLSPSLRISYMVLPEKLLKEFKEKMSFIICPVPMIEQKVLCRFILDGYFERHLNKMRNIYKKKREALTTEIAHTGSPMEVVGADAGLHLILRVDNGMSEGQLVDSAFRAGVRVYGLSKYYLDKEYLNKTPELLLGYATMGEEEIVRAVGILNRAWFGDLKHLEGQVN